METYELDLQQKDQEMYDLKHELISLRMQIEEAQKDMSRMRLTRRTVWKAK